MKLVAQRIKSVKWFFRKEIDDQFSRVFADFNADDADTSVHTTLCQLFARCCHGQLAVLHALGSNQTVGYFLNLMALAFYD